MYFEFHEVFFISLHFPHLKYSGVILYAGYTLYKVL